MARPRTAPPAAEPEQPSEEELERQQAEHALGGGAHEGSPPQGPASLSSLPAETVRMLGEPLDPVRVKSRKGRGGGDFSYLETHDVKRAANRIFGHGAWGYRIMVQERIGEVEVERENQDGSKQRGWHIAYRCVVMLDIMGCVATEGSGYGDAVEYGPAARLTASELALKESESDALKRAFTKWGDQFGLILYAKGDDKARLESDQAADQAREVRRDTPMSLEEALGRMSSYVETGNPWVREAVERLHPEISEFTSMRVLDQTQRIDLLKRMQVVVFTLESSEYDTQDPEVGQRQVRAAFAAAFDGLVIEGPEPFQPPIPF